MVCLPERPVDLEAQLYVEFDHLRNPINTAGEELKPTIGNLVKTIVPISYMDWRKVSYSRKCKLWMTIQVVFYFHNKYGENIDLPYTNAN